jgi:MHS family proline/betaine transporter-like MFS transporter
MGYIGDTLGRKKALEISIFLMAFPTFAMGCLPSYEAVGWIAPTLLIIVRLLQGLSVGGQLMSSLVFTVERHPHEKWGLYGSFVMAAANFGTLLGGVMAMTLKTNLTDEQLHTWGWRLPFLSGILVSLSGLYLRHCVEDEPVSHVHGQHHEEGDEDVGVAMQKVNPVKEAFSRPHRRNLLAASMVPMLWSGGFYLTFVWMAVFMDSMVEPPVPNAFAVNTCALFFSVCLFFPVGGWLSDKWGRIHVMTMGGVSLMVFAPVALVVIGQGNALGAFIAQCCLGVCLTFWGAPMMAWLVESFPPESRLTAVAIGYNIAQALAGGTTPAFATYVVDTAGPDKVGWIVTMFAAIALIGLLCVAPKRVAYDMDNDLELTEQVDSHHGDEDTRVLWDVRIKEEGSKNQDEADKDREII